MSKSHLDALRRQLAQAESSNDLTVTKLKGTVTFLHQLVRSRQERDEAIVTMLNEDRIALETQVNQVIGEVNAVISDLTGPLKVIDGETQRRLPQQGEEQAA